MKILLLIISLITMVQKSIGQNSNTTSFIGTYFTQKDTCKKKSNKNTHKKYIMGFKLEKSTQEIEGLRYVYLESEYSELDLVEGKKYIVVLRISINEISSPILKSNEIIEITEIMDFNDFFTVANFDNVYSRIIRRPSRVILTKNHNEWEVLFSSEDGLDKIIFRKNGYLIGNITKNLDIIALAKFKRDNERIKNEIKEIFYDIYAWSIGDFTIQVEWASKY